ncbi:hypothetical protein Pmani_002555 [Petrolisthes manimaculis]|uniref:G-protein coupled receptors family 2 profile 2 domain-containing protein n=1 Tax=Petrolisthes manimaculis TaxID=1843537 RepID=A0AAE1QKR9_9EUCA|nr:hypothetical protein Pmani_002555 [Petrolisthes manimaculis]
MVQVLVRLVLYADQTISRGDSTGLGSGISQHRHGIDSTPILCESFYILLEYGRSAMFMWMFIEGMYLNNLISANLLFLLNIMRILLSKLREASTSEAQQIRPLRRSVRNALFLLPLLGITNAITMIPSPLERSAFEFGVWSYGTNLLTSFQGLVVACIYCFFNGDVKRTLCYYWHLRVTLRSRTRRSASASAFPDAGGLYDSGYGPRPPKLHFKARSRSSSDKPLPDGHLQTFRHNPTHQYPHGTHQLHTSPYHVTMPVTSL